MIKTIDIEGRVITTDSAVEQKLDYSFLKAKQMDVVMGIVSERNVFTTLREMGKIGYICLLYTYGEALFIIYILFRKFVV